MINAKRNAKPAFDEVAGSVPEIDYRRAVSFHITRTITEHHTHELGDGPGKTPGELLDMHLWEVTQEPNAMISGIEIEYGVEASHALAAQFRELRPAQLERNKF